MHFHERFHAEYLQNTHMAHTVAARWCLLLPILNVEREKLLQGPILQCSLWTSVVQQSPLLSILMPTSNCENLSCFRRKSIPCVNPLLFSCIMFFAMKGSYEAEDFFVFFFFFLVGCFYVLLILSCVYKEAQQQENLHMVKLLNKHGCDGARHRFKTSGWNTVCRRWNASGWNCTDCVFAFMPRFCVYYRRIPVESTPMKSLCLHYDADTIGLSMHLKSRSSQLKQQRCYSFRLYINIRC